jgi:TnsA endonuclease N terminal/TnsA endonuclease C terminal
MAKPQRRLSQSTVEKRLKEGRGSGRGANYLPWLLIHDVPSKGRVTRQKGWKTGRVHHLLSDLERDTFLTYEWAPSVIDIREQYPLLPLEETLAIAEECHIRHPCVRNSGKSGVDIPVVMTTDFVITVQIGLESIDQARTVKYAQDLESPRTLEKFEIERRYWARRNIDWKIVTEREISRVLARNVQFIHRYLTIEDRLSLPQTLIHEVAAAMTTEVMRGRDSLSTIALVCDEHFKFDPGTCLTIAYHLLATRQWEIDMHTPLDPGKRLLLLNKTL